MAILTDIDREKRDQFLAHAATADAMARKTPDVSDRATWLSIAESFRDMADRITRNYKF